MLKMARFLCPAFLLPFFLGVSPLCAQEVTIVFTGETHSVLYPCDCPREPDGGVFRRATAIDELRRKSAGLILVESGGFFSGGQHDVYSQNVDLDKKRALAYLKAVDMMGYDALGIGEDEFNFGADFLKEAVKGRNARFLSANLRLDGVIPYVIKETAGLKFGITGAIPEDAGDKAAGAPISDPVSAVKKAVVELKVKGADFIILVSQLGEENDQKILADNPDISVVVISHSRVNNEVFSRAPGGAIILRPAWQGKKLGVLELKIADKKIVNAKADEMRLWDKLADSRALVKALPRCFQDSDCKKGAVRGSCSNGGSNDAQCKFDPPEKIKVTVVQPKDCAACDSLSAINRLKQFFPGLETENLVYESAQGRMLAGKLGIKALPAYVFEKKMLSGSKHFEGFKKHLVDKGDYYFVAPSFSGISYFPERAKTGSLRLDVFISLFDVNAYQVLKNTRKFNPEVHFLAMESQNGDLSAQAGINEVEEDLRAVCVMKYYSRKAYDYLLCRAQNIKSSWWDDCASGMDSEKVRLCARSEDGKRFLRENIMLNKELGISSGPTYLMNNVEIFSSLNPPTEDELKAVFDKAASREPAQDGKAQKLRR